MKTEILTISLLLLVALVSMPTISSAQDSRSLRLQTLKRQETKEELVLVFMHESLMEGIQNALAYPLLNDIAKREECLISMMLFDELASNFRGINGLKDERMKEEFHVLTAAKYRMMNSILNVFTTFETTQKVDPEDIRVLEDDIDIVTAHADKLMEIFFGEEKKRKLNQNRHYLAALYVVMMRTDVSEAVEEAMAYLLLGDVEEQKDFKKKVRDFEHLAVEFKRLEKVGEGGSEEVTELYEEMNLARKALVAAGDKMHKNFETDGKVSQDNIREFEKNTNKFTMGYRDLLENILRKI